MDSPKKLLKTIEKWAKAQENIRALILLGSRAHKGGIDRLSDIDLYIFAIDPKMYFNQEDWFQTFGPVWLAQQTEDVQNITWKVIYEGGLMVEFTIAPYNDLERIRLSLPPHFEPGYNILVDKDNIAKGLPKPGGKPLPPEEPTLEAFQETLSEFWLNAFHVAKYLWRRDLWRAKHHDWQMKANLLKMMGWHALLLGQQDGFTTYEGKGLQTWADPETFTSLMTVFGRFYPADSWRAMEDTIKIFTRLSNNVANHINADPRVDLQKKIMPLIKELQSNPLA